MGCQTAHSLFPWPSDTTYSHTPNAAGGQQPPSPLQSSSDSAVCSPQTPAIPFPALSPLHTHTHTNTPERKTYLISISYNRHCISYLHPPPQYTKRSSDSKESPQSFIQLFIVCKTLSSPGSPSTFITGLGGEEGSAIFPFYR